MLDVTAVTVPIFTGVIFFHVQLLAMPEALFLGYSFHSNVLHVHLRKNTRIKLNEVLFMV